MKTKVLHIIKSLGRGGAEMLLPETLKLHDKDQFEFHYIYFLPWKDQMVASLEEAGAKVTCLPAKNNMQLMRQIDKVDRYIKKHEIQLVHAHLPWAGFLARFLHKSNPVPLIYTEHNKQERYHKVTFWLNKFTFNWQSKAIAVSADVHTSIKQHLKPKVSVQTVLNGVNTDFFQRQSLDQTAEAVEALADESTAITFRANETEAAELPFDNGKEVLQELIRQKRDNHELQVVGTIAVFRFQKRLVEWIKVFHTAAKENPNLRGVIVGNGPFAAQLLQLRTEESGLLVAVEEWESLAEKLAQLRDKELRNRLAKGARKRVEEAFSLKRMVRELEEVYLATAKG